MLAFVGLIDVFSFQTESREHLDDYELSDTFGVPRDGSMEDQALTEFQDGQWIKAAVMDNDCQCKLRQCYLKACILWH